MNLIVDDPRFSGRAVALCWAKKGGEKEGTVLVKRRGACDDTMICMVSMRLFNVGSLGFMVPRTCGWTFVTPLAVIQLGNRHRQLRIVSL